MENSTGTAQFTLTSEFESNPAAIPFFDALSAAARVKLNAPSAWEWYDARVLQPTDDTLLTGGVPNAGRKGRGRWKGVVGQQVVITRAEMEEACARYERDTGKCYQCAGTGSRFSGWSSNAGTRVKLCERCGGKGAAPDSPP